MKIRKIDNTAWIKNFFLVDDYLYITNSEPYKKNCFIAKVKVFKVLENLKIRSNINRYFLSNPNPTEFNPIEGSMSDLEIVKLNQLFVQNVYKFKESICISLVDDNKIIENKTFEGELINELQDCIYFGYSNDEYIFKKNRNCFLYNKQKFIELDFVNIISFADSFVIQNSYEQIFLYNKKFKCIKKIDDSRDYKKIYYINERNVLISNYKENITYIYNIDTCKKNIFSNFFISRALMINKDLMIIKQDKNDNISFIN
ncbi:hypothetical protein [Spiroplasma turonicum]|uniref:Uncharacterized protein n=1 Tax=Spiroplasma turonicum TaxID=216946 RepID=A0A0K1P523_9MOLU|nr:hypothetical protein [Spiroplasma turonicum]AKU79416.1 hypothetical protein STURON_00170 [Spiroplasma turonicum]ALX70437.1 hypothetical protein STURO_v1c01680 [Spiroplasma turonicum]